MTEAEARVILTRMRDGCDPFTGEALPENHPYASLRIVSALHIALRAMDGVSLGTQNIKETPPKKRREKRNDGPAQIKRTETALGHSGTPWTKEDRSLLRLRLKQAASLEDIARELKRTPFETQEKLGWVRNTVQTESDIIIGVTLVKGENLMLELGTKAPDFALINQNGETVKLSDFVGRKVILYFYPKDNTPGCTRQACAFAGSYEAFKTLNAVVIGVSKDSAASHAKFAAKYELPFILLSDPELQAIQAYGVWQEKKLYGKVSMGVVRTTYVIDENGVIEKVMPKVKPDTNAAEILTYLEEKGK